MGCASSSSESSASESERKSITTHHAMDKTSRPARHRRDHSRGPTEDESKETSDPFGDGIPHGGILTKGVSIERILKRVRHPPTMKPIEQIHEENTIFTMKPLRNDSSYPNAQTTRIGNENMYQDIWDDDHVRMPCSKQYRYSDKTLIWPIIQEELRQLQSKCHNQKFKFKDLKNTIERCNGRHFQMDCLEFLIDKAYRRHEADEFKYYTLPKMCDLVLRLESICTQPLPLLKTGVNFSVTMKQSEAASLLACAFFCLFPDRSGSAGAKRYKDYQDPNFERLYHNGSQSKLEKLKCIIHYFKRVTDQMPTGAITFQRYVLHRNLLPRWSNSEAAVCELHLTTGQKIEDIKGVLQVDFANKYIGGGVLGSGCVQEEIRFTICPEMLVSLLICEVMEKNECIFLIGCERFSNYKGYAHSFQFDGDHKDKTPRDNWGRKECHVVAMDAIYFANPSGQYHMDSIERELMKAYTSFRPLGESPDFQFGIATGNWGCGAFNGDRQLKAIIQLMAASEAKRPLIYAAFGDKNLVTSFSQVYDKLRQEEVTVGELYGYLKRYCDEQPEPSLFQYILHTPIPGPKSRL